MHCIVLVLKMVFCFLISKSTKKYRNHIKRLKGVMSSSSTSSNCFCYCDNKIYFLFTYMQEVCHNSLLHKHSHNNNTDCV